MVPGLVCCLLGGGLAAGPGCAAASASSPRQPVPPLALLVVGAPLLQDCRPGACSLGCLCRVASLKGAAGLESGLQQPIGPSCWSMQDGHDSLRQILLAAFTAMDAILSLGC